jgi:flavorubredoxin
MYDVSSTHVSYLIAETFKLSHIVLASPTYNLGIYPMIHNYLIDMQALAMRNRTFAILENGSWAPKAGDLIYEFLDKELKEMTILDDRVTVNSSLNEMAEGEMASLVESLVQSLKTT